MLGHTMAASTLQKTLNEEGETDKKLTKLAEGTMLTTGINEKAR
jgi:ferritin-like metal-binding protein YciE